MRYGFNASLSWPDAGPEYDEEFYTPRLDDLEDLKRDEEKWEMILEAQNG